MGKFIYNTEVRQDFDDRLLFHLQNVIGAKLRRQESFFFTYRIDNSAGGGRHTLWINPTAALVFKYSGSRQSGLSRPWLEALTALANSPGGLHVIPEPTEAETPQTVSAGHSA